MSTDRRYAELGKWVIYTDPDNGNQLGLDEDGWYWYRKQNGEWKKAESVSFSVDLNGRPMLAVVW